MPEQAGNYQCCLRACPETTVAATFSVMVLYRSLPETQTLKHYYHCFFIFILAPQDPTFRLSWGS